MHFLTYFYKKILNYELINKFTYKNSKKIPKLKKIILNFGCKTTDIKHLTASLLALELITYQKSKFTTTKYPNIVLKLRKGNPVGCKVELRNKKMYFFLENILMEVFPKIKNFDGLTSHKNFKKNTFSFKFNDNFVFKPIEEHYYLFNTLPKLDVTILTTSKKTIELNFIIKSLQFPIKPISKYNSIGRV
jgi:large subunit ribosomal protein L5